MSASDPKQTLVSDNHSAMSAFGNKADMMQTCSDCLLMNQSGRQHRGSEPDKPTLALRLGASQVPKS
jgi:hypothetical protein